MNVDSKLHLQFENIQKKLYDKYGIKIYLEEILNISIEYGLADAEHILAIKLNEITKDQKCKCGHIRKNHFNYENECFMVICNCTKFKDYKT